MNTINRLLFLITLCNLCACSSDVLDTNLVRDESISLKKGGYYLNEQGALTFTSLDAYFALTDSLNHLSENEFCQWEKSHHFISYRTFVNNIIDKADEMKDKDQVITFLKQYADYVYIDENELVQPVIQSQTYQSIANKEGIFYVEEAQNKVGREYVTISKNVTKSEAGYIDQIRYIKEKSFTKAYGDEVEYPTIAFVNRDNDRKIFTSFKITKNAASNGTVSLCQPQLEIFVRARKWVPIAKWKDYNTICIVENVILQMDGIPFSPYVDENGQWIFGDGKQIKFLAPVESKEAARFTSTYRLTTAPIMMQAPLQDIICIHYRARTRGTGEYGAAYNVYHPNPDMNLQDCGHTKVEEHKR